MRIFDENDNELREEDIDLEVGYLTPDRKFIRHHDAVEGQERQAHYTVSAFYFEDGTKYEPQSEDDPHIHVDDAKAGLFSYNDVEGTGKKLRGIDLKEIEDSPAIPAQEAWDEYEDIQVYHIYTPEEIERREREAEEQRKREEFENTGLARIEALETATEPIPEMNQSIESLEIATEPIPEMGETIEDLVLTMADLLGIEK